MDMAVGVIFLMLVSFAGGVYLGRKYSYVKFTMTPA